MANVGSFLNLEVLDSQEKQRVAATTLAILSL